MPIFADRLGDIGTSQNDIKAFVEATRKHGIEIPHYEVETYAWNVLPEQHKNVLGDLSSGIAEELRWFHSQLNA